MQASHPKVSVTGGCPLQRAALTDWLLAHGFGIAPRDESESAGSDSLVLFLCPEHNPAAELSDLTARHPVCNVLAILSCNCERAMNTFQSSGLPNVFCADEPPHQLAVAIRAVLAGQNYRSPAYQRHVSRPHGTDGPAGTLLSPRELDVLRLLAQGFTKKRIAENLHLSVKTIDNHSTSIMSKLNIHNRVDLARYAIREGIAIA